QGPPAQAASEPQDRAAARGYPGPYLLRAGPGRQRAVPRLPPAEARRAGSRDRNRRGGPGIWGYGEGLLPSAEDGPRSPKQALPQLRPASLRGFPSRLDRGLLCRLRAGPEGPHLREPDRALRDSRAARPVSGIRPE